jgi:hypothetical protein
MRILMPDVKGIVSLPISELTTNGNVRVDASASPALVASVLQHGIISPLSVRNTDDGWVVTAGHRRLNAAIEAGLTDVPVHVIVGRKLSDADVIGMQIAENLHRKELSSYELAQAAWDLKLDGQNQGAVAAQMGVSKKDVSELQKIGKVFNADDDLDPALATQLTTRALFEVAESDQSPSELTRLIVEENKTIWSAESIIEREVAVIEFEEVVKPKLEEWEEAGVVITHEVPKVRTAQMLDVDAQSWAHDRLRIAVEDHISLVCHVVVVTGTPSIQHWCIKTGNHLKADSKVKATDTDDQVKAKSTRSDEAKSNREEKQARRAAVLAWKPKRTDIRMMAMTAFVKDSWREDQVRLALNLLDLTKERKKGAAYGWHANRIDKWFVDQKMSDEAIEAFKAKIILGFRYVEKQWPAQEVTDGIEGKKK